MIVKLVLIDDGIRARDHSGRTFVPFDWPVAHGYLPTICMACLAAVEQGWFTDAGDMLILCGACVEVREKA